MMHDKFLCDECNWHGNDPNIEIVELDSLDDEGNKEEEYLEHCPNCNELVVLNPNDSENQLNFIMALDKAYSV